MNTKKLLLSIALLLCVAVNANNEKIKAMFTSRATITDVETSLSFFIPEINKEVFVLIAGEDKKIFQKIKVYQRGNGIILCDKTGLKPGTYYYTLSVDGVLSDTQKCELK